MVEVVGISLVFVILFSLAMNLLGLSKQIKKVRAAGQTPLIKTSVLMAFTGAVGEFIVSMLIMYTIFEWCNVKETVISAAVTFMFAYVLRNAGSYLARWATIEISVRIDRRKMKKQLEKDQKAAL